ncbi:MAG: dUTP diphosphatase [Candidatus Krumholzibacteria bacterium]|nr:dUTP diphosphatase [Candidatus Krumholzibacteria bacterium]
MEDRSPGSVARVGVRYLPHHDGLPPLEQMTAGSSGFDIHAACSGEIVVGPGRAALVPAGFELSIPRGLEAQVRPRSGLALRERIGLLNSPGTIDSDYRGEVGVILFNFGDSDFAVRRGDRIAQIVFCALPPVELAEAGDLDGTARGSGGFGHTGRGRER